MPSVSPEPEPFRFCPVDGSALDDPDKEEGSRCPRCGRAWYRNSSPVVGCVIVHEGKALVTVRGIEPHKGKLDVPGGFLLNGEDPIEGLKREIREELGIEIEAGVGDCLAMAPHVYAHESDYNLALGFRARWVSGEPAAADDVAELRWVSPEELEKLDFAWEHDRELVRKALRHEESEESQGSGPR
ncbi:MAG TPA: NUDIX domain-containing protein [Actinomycetota bacterium]|nr:NUDIX domain-containing protein [Actinomycetota bacterium]